MKKKNRKKSPSKHILRTKLINFVLIMLCIYFAYSMLSTQIQVYREKRALEQLNQQIKAAQLENDDLNSALSGGEDKLKERYAREKLGYGDPEERVVKDH